MFNPDVSVNYGGYSPVSPRSKRIGATVLGGLIGMTCYYLPVNKDLFVGTAFNVARKNTEKNIKALEIAADEISKNKLTNENKIFLAQIGVSENLQAIAQKCRELKESITDKDKVIALKKDYAANFKQYVKDESLMDTVTSKAMSTLRWNGFKWGMAIGGLLGAALSLLATRDN